MTRVGGTQAIAGRRARRRGDEPPAARAGGGRDASARTCSTGSTCCASTCRRCASGARTSRSSSGGSSASCRRGTSGRSTGSRREAMQIARGLPVAGERARAAEPGREHGGAVARAGDRRGRHSAADSRRGRRRGFCRCTSVPCCAGQGARWAGARIHPAQPGGAQAPDGGAAAADGREPSGARGVGGRRSSGPPSGAQSAWPLQSRWDRPGTAPPPNEVDDPGRGCRWRTIERAAIEVGAAGDAVVTGARRQRCCRSVSERCTGSCGNTSSPVDELVLDEPDRSVQ